VDLVEKVTLKRRLVILDWDKLSTVINLLSPRKDMNFNFDTPEKDAAKAMGIATDTLKKRRLKGDIPPHVYTKIGYKMLRYCIPLLKDWQLDPDDMAAQARAIELVQDSRPSNVPRKRGRKAAV
jgi:hypothetical protein